MISAMRAHMYRPFKSLVLVFCTFLLVLISCNQAEIQEPPEIGQPPTSSDCRLVQHEMGETCIPVQPQRIIALDFSAIPDSLLALGIKPIAITYATHFDRKLFNGLSADDIAGIESVGRIDQPSLEKILELKPDLIISVKWNGEPIYELLSEIAPTVVVDVNETIFSPHENFLKIAEILDRKDEAESIIDEYHQKATATQEHLGEQIEDVEVAYIAYVRGNFYVPSRSAALFEVLRDVGVNIKPVSMERGEWLPISIEVADRYASDFLFILNVDNKPESFFLQNPILSQLEAVKNNQAYVVDIAVGHPHGPLGMNRLLDEIPKYLLGVNAIL